jgi:hypothetical protein
MKGNFHLSQEGIMPFDIPLKTHTGLEVVVRGLEIPDAPDTKANIVEFIAMTAIDGEPIATIRVVLKEFHVWIIDMKHDQAFRGAGIRSLLMEQCKIAASGAGYTHIFVMVYSEEDAAFYESQQGLREKQASGFDIFSWGL